MKRIYLVLIFLCLKTLVQSQGINLEKGQELIYRIFLYEENEKKYIEGNNEDEITESLERIEINFNVIDIFNNSYVIKGSSRIIDQYSRVTNPKTNKSKTKSYYVRELVRDSSEMKRYSSMIPLSLDFVFTLTKAGGIITIDLYDSLDIIEPFNKITRKPLFPSVDSSVVIKDKKDELNLKSHYKEFLSSYFFNIEKENQASKIDMNSGILLESSNIRRDSNEVSYILSWRFSNTTSSKKRYINKETNYVFTRLVKYSNRSVMQSNPKDFDSNVKVYEKNIILKGKVKNAKSDQIINLLWIETKPEKTDIQSKMSRIQPDGSFIIELYSEDLLKVSFLCGQEIELYLSPGDDVTLHIDMNDFYQSLKAEGKGSEAYNFMIDKYRYEDQHKLNLKKIRDNLKTDYLVYYPEQFKKQYLKILNEKQQFLSQYKWKLPPEIYQSQYWENRISIAEILDNYPGNQKHFRKEENLAPYQITKNTFFNMGELVHPDNDLMEFCQINRLNNYEDQLKSHVFPFLMNTCMETSGIDIKDFNTGDDQMINPKYAFCDAFFTGKTEHTLKYLFVIEKFQKSNFQKIKKHYNLFKDEYPFSSKTKTLTKSFAKIKKISPGQPAPDFELKNLEGEKVKLSDYKGKVVYLIFWSVDGFYGNEELTKDIDSLKAKIDCEDIVFVLVSFWDKTKTLELIKKYNIEGIQLLAGNQKAILFSEYFIKHINIFSSPVRFIIDREGIIRQFRVPHTHTLIKNPQPLLDALEPLKKDRSAQTILILKILSISFLSLIFIALTIIIINKRRAAQKIKWEKLNTQVRELELRAIRAQMNPHFMYNCLNSIQNLVQKNQLEPAHLYLSKFADLIRKTLKHSEKEEIALSEEIETIQQYIELEQLRFDFRFEIVIEKKVDVFSIFIPPLLLQPLVENAIIHGLSNNKDDKKLSLNIKRKQNQICIIIQDNGIGRKASAMLSKSTTGKGINFTKERLDLLKEKYNTDNSLVIEDIINNDGKIQGTKVEICIMEE